VTLRSVDGRLLRGAMLQRFEDGILPIMVRPASGSTTEPAIATEHNFQRHCFLLLYICGCGAVAVRVRACEKLQRIIFLLSFEPQN
jgi:hypothetical protein